MIQALPTRPSTSFGSAIGAGASAGPELYDEMCHVASRGLYHGWGFGELAEHGIAFGLAEMPRLAGLVGDVSRQDAERRGRILVAVLAPAKVGPDSADEAPEEASRLGAFAGAAR